MIRDRAVARRRMVREQIAGAGIDDPAVLRVLGEIPRHRFVPAALQHRAYQASALPYLTGGTPAVADAAAREQGVARLLANAVFYRSRPDLFEAYCLDPTNGNARYLMSLEFAGNPPESEGFCLERAVRAYRQLLAQHPEDPRVLNALADALAQADELDEALLLARKAADLAPRDGMILDTLGWIQHLRGDHDAALATLEEAEVHLRGHPIVLYHIGVVHDALGDDAAARAALQQALASERPFPDRDTAEALLATYD